MSVRNPEDIRNILFVGQSGSGKTTLAERLLHDSGTTTRMGSVEEGTTVSDWTEEEKHHKHSLRASVLHFDFDGHLVNLIDAPGLADFSGHAIACFPAVETVAVVVDSHRGIEPMTRRMMNLAKDRNLPRMFIINKMEEQQAELESLVEQLRETFGNSCLPINLPAADRGSVVNVFEEAEGAETLFSSVDDAHTQIIEQVVEVNEDLMSKYLEGGADSLDKTRVHEAFEQALREGHLVPICFVSSKTGAGAKDLMHVMASLLPNPMEGNPRPFLMRETEDAPEVEFHAEPDPEKPLLAHTFNVSSDKHVGKLGIFRVHQGTLRPKTEVYIGDHKKGVRIGHLVKRQGKDSTEIEALGPGDIGAVTKVDEIAFDAVLHSSHDFDSVHLKPLPLPKPMYGLAVEIKTHGDDAKFSTAVQKLAAEDPCFKVEQIQATKQTVMRGLGELHLRVVLEKLSEQFGVEVETSPPKVAYKETIAGKAEGHHRHKKQTGGAGQFGEVYLRVEPLPQDHETGFEFVNATVGGSIPRQFMPAIEKGIRQALADGAVAGYPLTGVKVEVYDGKHHPVDSKEVAFITAGKRAFIDAVRKAHPALLEPFVEVDITVPQAYMGDVTGDMANRRGRVQDTVMLPGDQCSVRAVAPLGELQNFSNELKSMTGGSGSYTMDYSHDEQTPPHVQQEVIAAYKPHEEDD